MSTPQLESCSGAHVPTPESDLDPDAFLTTESSSTGHSPAHSSHHTTRDTPPTSTSWNSTGHSSATTTYYNRRYYRHSSTQSLNPLRDPNELYCRIWSRNRAALEEHRVVALQTIASCHQVVTTLELARMTATRIGIGVWFNFWAMVYHRPQLNSLMAWVTQAVRRIDILFRNTANRLHAMLNQRQSELRYAATEAQMTWELELVEDLAIWNCDRRRRKAWRIMEKLHSNLQNSLNMPVTADKMIDMMRGIFGLDCECDYYPHRVGLGHTRVVLPQVPVEEMPRMAYDPYQIPPEESLVLVDGTWQSVDAGFRPAGNYERDPHRLL